MSAFDTGNLAISGNILIFTSIHTLPAPSVIKFTQAKIHDPFQPEKCRTFLPSIDMSYYL